MRLRSRTPDGAERTTYQQFVVKGYQVICVAHIDKPASHDYMLRAYFSRPAIEGGFGEETSVRRGPKDYGT
jgi:hypothetical protein